MGSIDNNTLTQIHSLIDAYFEAKTTEKEEKLLKELLVNIDVSTPKIDEARAVMGLFAYKRKALKLKSRKKKFTLIPYIKYAAIITVIALTSIMIINHSTSQEHINMAWVGGKVITDENTTLGLLSEQLQDMSDANETTVATVSEAFNDITKELNQ